MDMSQIATVILAAGKGTRMKSGLPKVLMPVMGRPMLDYVLARALDLRPKKIIVVVGYQANQVIRAFEGLEGVDWVLQPEQRGTGHAIQVAKDALNGFQGDVLVLYGDVPLISLDTLGKLTGDHQKYGSTITLLSAELDDPDGYGRIVKNSSGQVICIREQKDASEAEKKIKRINTGIGVFKAPFLMKAIFDLKTTNEQNEYYLTDVIGMAVDQGLDVRDMLVEDSGEVMGANDPEGLKRLEQSLKSR